MSDKLPRSSGLTDFIRDKLPRRSGLTDFIRDKVPKCSGFIVFDNDNNTIIVTCKKNGFSGFPKGKREKKESSFENAVRELKEETNISINQIDIVNEKYLDEITSSKIVIRYYIAKLNQNIDIKFDLDELTNVEFINIDKCKNIILESRYNILLEANRVINSPSSVLIKGDKWFDKHKPKSLV
jgi:8-oxo-dGTP pyrophosphatase MutT (NUDIX family)